MEIIPFNHRNLQGLPRVAIFAFSLFPETIKGPLENLLLLKATSLIQVGEFSKWFISENRRKRIKITKCPFQKIIDARGRNFEEALNHFPDDSIYFPYYYLRRAHNIP